ncbi:MAG: hypothetical protein F4219_09025 [Gammaproteobacteria bacterium]|nr:hypothetical protein [Gammaproteobacteria bacterium]
MRISSQSLISAILGMVLIVALPSSLYAERKVTSSETGDIVASDLTEMQEFSVSQYELLLEKLEVADSLSDNHRELVATALSKDLEGLPLCTFNQEIVYREETEKSETRLLTVHEDGLITDNKERKRMYFEWKYSPYSAPPAAGIDFSSGTLIEETESDLTFQFRFDKKAKSASENVTELLGDLGRVAKNLRYQLRVDAQTGAPKSLVLELIKKTRVMVIARVTKIRHEYVYEYDEATQRYYIPTQFVEFAYSAPTRGKVDERIDVTYSNFHCETPTRYVWRAPLDLQESTSSVSNP